MTKRTTAAALLAVAVVMGGGFVPGAADARVITGNDARLAAEDVDKHRPLILTVRKVAKPPFDDIPAGQKPPAIEGAVFTLSRVNGIDVTTTAGREEAKRLTVEQARQRGVTRVAQGTTNANGTVTFSGLEPALYLLEESAPDGQYNYHLSSPRLIILPLGNTSGTGFEYENVVVTKPGPPSTTTPPTTPGTPPTTTPGTPPPGSTPPPGQTPPPGTSPSTTPPPPPGGPGEPPADTPPQPGSPGSPDRPGSPDGPVRSGGPLASTGANVLWAVALGGLFILAGYLLVRRNNTRTD